MGKREKTGGLSKADKWNRILAAALGFVATAGAFAAFAQSEAPREWKSRRGKTVVTGTLDVKQTNQEFAADAETPEKVFFRGGDGKLYSFAYENLADADKKRVDVALGLTAEVVDSDPANSANSINNANLANDAIPASGGDSESRALKAVPKDCVRRAVLVGVDDYAEFGDLRFAGADVELIRSRLLELGFAPENIVALTTESGRSNSKFAPTKRNIERELSRILAASSPDDMIFVMFTGHGFQTDNFGGYGTYVGFAPSDAVPNDETVVDFASMVSLSKLFDEMKDCRARFKWALVDACRENLGLDASGGGLVASKSLARSKALRKLEAPAGVAILQSCAEGEFSWEKDGHGVFTRTFAESLTEVGDANEDGAVTLFEAATRTMDEVKRETSDRSTFDATQTPYLSGYATNFVVADVKTAEAKERWRAAVEAREKGDYATALTEIDAALALMPEKTEYATEKRAIEAFAAAAKKAKAEAQAAAEKARREAESAAQAERERLEAELAAAKAEAEKAKEGAERKAKEEAAARANAERQAQNAGRTSAPGTGTTSAEASASGGWFDKHEPGTLKTLTVDGIEYRFRYCPAGTFTMGSPESESGREDDETQHRVTLDGFWMLETEVTVAMWRSFVKATGYTMGLGYKGQGGYGFNVSEGKFEFGSQYTWKNPGFPQTDAHPVTQVDWAGAVAFCEWLSKETGASIRLPSEAEWEYACRAGSTTAYSFGSNDEDLTKYGNVADASAKRKISGWTTVASDDGYVFTAPVKKFNANAWNLYDMHGNVWEWCADWYDSDYYQKTNNARNPINVINGTFRVLRGCGWLDVPERCRSASRVVHVPTLRSSNCGFRLALGREL